jgi:ParB-like chromosome segregation protein Spo0J
MAGESGTSVSETKRQLETSKRVKRLPKTANAMRKGTLSPEKVQAIASAANVDPDAEAKLLEGAETKPLGELRKECLNAKGKDRDKAHARIHRDRYARAGTITTSRPTAAGRSAKAKAADSWSRPTTPDTPTTDRPNALEARAPRCVCSVSVLDEPSPPAGIARAPLRRRIRRKRDLAWPAPCDEPNADSSA